MIQAILVALQIAAFFITEATFDPNLLWQTNLLALCKATAPESFHNESLKAVGYTFAGYGAYWGMLARRKWFASTVHQPTTWFHLKYLGRVAVLIVLCLPWAALLLVPKIK